MRRRMEKGPEQRGLRAVMATKCREMASRHSRDLAAHWLEWAERWELDEPIVVQRWKLPAEYKPPVPHDWRDHSYSDWLVAADGSLTRMVREHHGSDIEYVEWDEPPDEPDPRAA